MIKARDTITLVRVDDGAKGDPTGITVSASEPTNKYTGMLWKCTGNVSGKIQNATYRWNGSSWELYIFIADNIDVDSLFAKSITAKKMTIEGDSVFKGKIDGATGTFAGSVMSDSIYVGNSKSNTNFRHYVSGSNGTLELGGSSGNNASTISLNDGRLLLENKSTSGTVRTWWRNGGIEMTAPSGVTINGHEPLADIIVRAFTVSGKTWSSYGYVDVPISTPSDYTFLAILNVCSVGAVCPFYVDTGGSTETYARVWNPGNSVTCGARVQALYYRKC